jgi:hypothetical protein
VKGGRDEGGKKERGRKERGRKSVDGRGKEGTKVRLGERIVAMLQQHHILRQQCQITKLINTYKMYIHKNKNALAAYIHTGNRT